MKTTNSIFPIFKFFSFILLISIVLSSCNKESLQKDASLDNKQENSNTNVFVKNIQKDSKPANQLRASLSAGNSSSRSLDVSENIWDFDNMIEVSNPDENKFVYMVSNKNNPNLILGGCSNESNNITTFFIFEKNGEIYTLKDQDGKPVLDAKIDFDKLEITFVNIYNANETRASVNTWCGLGMGVVGGVAAAFIPMTLGASIGFAACWGLVAGLMC